MAHLKSQWRPRTQICEEAVSGFVAQSTGYGPRSSAWQLGTGYERESYHTYIWVAVLVWIKPPWLFTVFGCDEDTTVGVV